MAVPFEELRLAEIQFEVRSNRGVFPVRLDLPSARRAYWLVGNRRVNAFNSDEEPTNDAGYSNLRALMKLKGDWNCL